MLRGLVGRGDSSSQTDGFGSQSKDSRAPSAMLLTATGTTTGWTGIPAISLLSSRARAWPVPHALRPRSKLALVRFPNTGAMDEHVAGLARTRTGMGKRQCARETEASHTCLSACHRLPCLAVGCSRVQRPGSLPFANCRTTLHTYKYLYRPYGRGRRSTTKNHSNRRTAGAPHHTGTLEHRRALPSTDRIGRGTAPV